jgi:hypothetical protein
MKTQPWGSFPAKTEDEVLFEDEYQNTIPLGINLYKLPSEKVEKTLEVAHKYQRREQIGILYGFAQLAIQDKNEEQLQALKKSNFLIHLNAHVGFLLAAHAIRCNNPNATELFIATAQKNFPHPDITIYQNKERETLAHFAVKTNQLEILKTIESFSTKKESLHLPNIKGETIIHLANFYLPPDVAKLLKITHAELSNVQDPNGNTTLQNINLPKKKKSLSKTEENPNLNM